VAPTGNVYVDQLRGREGCLPRPLPLATPGAGVEAGQVSCTISQVTFPIVGAICKCDTKPATPAVQSAIKNSARQSGLCGSASGVACDSPCACDLPQHSGAELMQCQTDANTPSAEMPPGFCYVDATAMPPIGSPALVADCPASSARELRITGPVPVESQPVLFLGCTAAQLK
jgi:hypothetical protein